MLNKKGFENRQDRILQDKKGFEVLSVWWMIVIAFIAVAIILTTIMFYTSDIDVKGAEADILSGKVLDCLTDGGKLNLGVVDGDFYSECGLDQEIIENGKYFVAIRVYGSGGELSQENIFGIQAMERDCEVKDELEQKSDRDRAVYYPRCSRKEVILGEGDAKVKLVVVGGSDHVGRFF